MFREPRLFSVSRTEQEHSLSTPIVPRTSLARMWRVWCCWKRSARACRDAAPRRRAAANGSGTAVPTRARGVQVFGGDSALSQVGVINRVTAGLAAVDVSTLYVSTYATDLILVPRYALGLLRAQAEAVLSGAPGPVGTAAPAHPTTAASTSLHLSPIPGSLCVMRAPRAMRAPLAFAAVRALFYPHTTPDRVDASSSTHRAAYCAWIECGEEITVVLPVALWPAFRASAMAGGAVVDLADAATGADAGTGGGEGEGSGEENGQEGDVQEDEGGTGHEHDGADADADTDADADADADGAGLRSPSGALVVHDVEWAAIHVAKGAVPLSDSPLLPRPRPHPR